MFRCYMTNFGWYLDGEFETVEAALAHGKSKGFEFSVHKMAKSSTRTEVVAAWTVFGGTHHYEASNV